MFLPGPRHLSILLLALSGCSDNSSGDTSTSSDPASTTNASSSTGSPTTGGTSGDIVGGQTDSSTGGGTTAETGTSGGASTGGSSESGEVGTTGEVACELMELARAAVEALGEYEDCGVVDPWDDLAPAWQAARDCALKAASEQRAFKLVTWMQGFDSQVGQAYVGLTHESYAISMFHYDSDPCGGGGCGPVAAQGYCAALVAVPNCVVEPGGACLSCAGQDEAVQICGPR